MQRKARNRSIFVTALFTLLFMFAAPPSRADSIPILAANATPGAPLIDGSYVAGQDSGFDEFWGFAFTLGQQFDNVTLQIEDFSMEPDFTVDAWLTNAIGPGSSAANVIAADSFSGIPIDDLTSEQYAALTEARVVTLFDANLGPGTYFVTLSAFEGPIFFWYETDPTTISSIPNAGFLGEFTAGDTPNGCGLEPNPPNCYLNYDAPWESDFGAIGSGVPGIFEIDGTPVPEPPALSIGLMGVLLIGWAYRRHGRCKEPLRTL